LLSEGTIKSKDIFNKLKTKTNWISELNVILSAIPKTWTATLNQPESVNSYVNTKHDRLNSQLIGVMTEILRKSLLKQTSINHTCIITGIHFLTNKYVGTPYIIYYIKLFMIIRLKKLDTK
jgi:hypothetical protein